MIAGDYNGLQGLDQMKEDAWGRGASFYVVEANALQNREAKIAMVAIIPVTCFCVA